MGAPCTSDADCAPAAVGTCLTTVLPGFFAPSTDPITYPGGYCSATCMSDQQCGAEGGCPGAGGFIQLPGGSNCLKRCNSPNDCREGYECRFPDDPLAALGGGISRYCQPPTPTEPPQDMDGGVVNDGGALDLGDAGDAG